jgi:hypothetical protein
MGNSTHICSKIISAPPYQLGCKALLPRAALHMVIGWPCYHAVLLAFLLGFGAAALTASCSQQCGVHTAYALHVSTVRINNQRCLGQVEY